MNGTRNFWWAQPLSHRPWWWNGRQEKLEMVGEIFELTSICGMIMGLFLRKTHKIPYSKVAIACVFFFSLSPFWVTTIFEIGTICAPALCLYIKLYVICQECSRVSFSLKEESSLFAVNVCERVALRVGGLYNYEKGYCIIIFWLLLLRKETDEKGDGVGCVSSAVMCDRQNVVTLILLLAAFSTVHSGWSRTTTISWGYFRFDVLTVHSRSVSSLICLT